MRLTSELLPKARKGDEVQVYFNLNAMGGAVYGKVPIPAPRKELLRRTVQRKLRGMGKPLRDTNKMLNTHLGGAIYSLVHGGKVIDHARSLRLVGDPVVFTTDPGAISRIRQKQTRDPCCYMEGHYAGRLTKEEIAYLWEHWGAFALRRGLEKEGWRRIGMNPFKSDTFVVYGRAGEEPTPLFTAREVVAMSDPKAPVGSPPSLILARDPNYTEKGYTRRETKGVRGVRKANPRRRNPIPQTLEHEGNRGTNRHLTAVYEGLADAYRVSMIPGMMGEHDLFRKSPSGRMDPERWERFVGSIRKEGIKYPALIIVEWGEFGKPSKKFEKMAPPWQDYEGPVDPGSDIVAHIYEGNHRTRAAIELGIPLPIEIRFFGGTEAYLDKSFGRNYELHLVRHIIKFGDDPTWKTRFTPPHRPAGWSPSDTGNPRRRNPKRIKTKLVDPSQVRLRGFSAKKTKIATPYIGPLLEEIRRMTGSRMKFPTPIVAMGKEEIREGRGVRDEGHEGGAGHGIYYPEYQLVKVNPNMEPIDILANIAHENLHHAAPDLHEVAVDQLTELVTRNVLGEANRGQPYAD
jgi:hypothetical protein